MVEQILLNNNEKCYSNFSPHFFSTKHSPDSLIHADIISPAVPIPFHLLPRTTHTTSSGQLALVKLRAHLVWVLKFNKHGNTFVLFNKKFLILD
jgi:hypothetical protein